MRILKRAKFVTRLYLGQSFASTRMHGTLRQMFNGWARIYSGVSQRRPARIFAAAAFVIAGSLSAYAAMIYGAVRCAQAGDRAWLAVAASHLVLMTIVLMALYRWSGNARRYALLFPLAGAMLSAIFAYAIRACRTGKIAWRGTSYSAGSASSAR
jgi:hypothetical protein